MGNRSIYGRIDGSQCLPLTGSSPPQNHNLEFLIVSSLIDLETKWWRIDVLRATFLPFEVETILKIPLSHNLLEDKIIWIGNKRGEFTMKSAYHIAYNLAKTIEVGESSSRDPCRLLWRKLWHLNLPAKVKIFAWRACVNGLPTFENMSKRGI